MLRKFGALQGASKLGLAPKPSSGAIRVRHSSCSSEARLRFAPSPTGFLHLGGLRTALFNHLYARKLKGKWILRIEDTDQSRLVPGAVEALEKTLEWAKLDYDEGPGRQEGKYGPYVQSERLDIYQKYCDKLIESGKAYRDFRPETAAAAAAAEAVESDGPRVKGIPIRNDYLPPDEDEARALIRDGKPFVVRLRAETGAMSHHDLVYGDIHFPADPLRAGREDPILMKSSGWPTYHLANVVDDHEMGITHVLRGEEWLPSLPKHLWLYKALGLTPPKFAHLPLLVNPDGSKLSKRTGDVRVEEYIAKGFEPEALNNFVALMGYNHHAGRHQQHQDEGSDYEVMDMPQMINTFDITNVSHSRASVSLPKLYFLNGRHISRKLDDEQLRVEIIAKVRPLIETKFPEAGIMSDKRLLSLIELTKGTCTTVNDIPTWSYPILRTPEWRSREARELFVSTRSMNEHFTLVVSTLVSILNDQSCAHSHPLELQDASRILKTLASRVADILPHQSTHQSHKNKLPPKRANVMAPIRFALTARNKGASLAEIITFLGREECITRLKNAREAV